MFTFRSKSLFAALALLVAGVVVLSGCAAGSPASVVAAAAVASQPSALQGGQGAPLNQAAVATAPATPAAGRTITVVGQGEVKTKPTVAHSQIGIDVTSDTVADAMQQARSQMDAVLKALKAQGIADNDVQTSNFSINFERQGPVPAKSPSGNTGSATASVAGVYHVSNMVNVTIRNLDKVGAVLDAAVSAGANNVWGVNFGIDDTSSLESQARQKAVADAKARAQALAQLNGVTLGDVVAVSEVVGQNGVMPMAAKSAIGMGGGGTPVEPGEVTFDTQIQVVYAIQ